MNNYLLLLFIKVPIEPLAVEKMDIAVPLLEPLKEEPKRVADESIVVLDDTEMEEDITEVEVVTQDQEAVNILMQVSNFYQS